MVKERKALFYGCLLTVRTVGSREVNPHIHLLPLFDLSGTPQHTVLSPELRMDLTTLMPQIKANTAQTCPQVRLPHVFKPS